VDTQNGADLGGENFTILSSKIAFLSGKGWFHWIWGRLVLFGWRVVGYPVSIVETGNFDRLELASTTLWF
jgi:hypothetical protein